MVHKDKVCIENIHVDTVIGVYEFEQKAPQLLLIDLELTSDFSAAFLSDNLEDALDYDDITQQVRAFCKNSRYALLEALAGGIIRLIFERPSTTISKVAVRIRKPEALKQAIPAIWCERTRGKM
ncbi:MAG: dihydroneopterin aldolase [Endozoicomonas sp. (ex Botrylloides leachii)]|nr:dihydroneopterin aldolase [Endozoicomonas sp. (ex Botrylloides leachii)]